MADAFLAEIRLMSFNFAPRYWAQCNGQLLPINQNFALYSLLGTTYGGSGTTHFALPDLRGRSPLHEGTRAGGSSHSLGERGGEAAHALTAAELPGHGHTLSASSDVANNPLPGAALPAGKPRGGINRYAPAGSGDTTLHAGSLTSTGSGQAHQNMQPFLTLNYCIRLSGIGAVHPWPN